MPGLEGSWRDWGSWGGGTGSQGGLPGRETLAALAPAGAKLPGKQGRLKGDEEAQDSHSAVRGP